MCSVGIISLVILMNYIVGKMGVCLWAPVDSGSAVLQNDKARAFVWNSIPGTYCVVINYLIVSYLAGLLPSSWLWEYCCLSQHKLSVCAERELYRNHEIGASALLDVENQLFLENQRLLSLDEFLWILWSRLPFSLWGKSCVLSENKIKKKHKNCN